MPHILTYLKKAFTLLFVQHRLPDLSPHLGMMRLRINYVFRRRRIRSICLWYPYLIGDYIQIHPVATTLKRLFPNAAITAICLPDRTIREVAGRIPSLDAIETDGSQLPSYKEFYSAYGKKYDLVLRPTPDYMIAGLAAYGPLISVLHRSIGISPDKNIKLEYTLRDEELAYAEDFIKKNPHYIILHADARSADDRSAAGRPVRKGWVDAYWQQLIDMQEVPVVLIGVSRYPLSGCIDLRNKITIHEAAALIKYCRLFVGVLSGPFWFTSVYEKNAIIINGGYELPIFTQHEKSYHFFSNVECAPCLNSTEKCPHDMKCMRMITPEMVHIKIKELLNT